MIGHIFGVITILGVLGLIFHYTKIDNLSLPLLITAWLMGILPITILLTLIMLGVKL